jgi:hypothetical protein
LTNNGKLRHRSEFFEELKEELKVWSKCVEKLQGGPTNSYKN